MTANLTASPTSSPEAERRAAKAGTVDLFKGAMRGVASTVFLVTTAEDGTPHGMAASAVTSVSMEPPSLLVAVNRSAGIHPVLHRVGRFCVNVLAADQVGVIAPFSDSARRAERFAGEGWARTAAGLPFLRTALSALCCKVDALMDYGTHTLFVGRVEEVVAGRGRSPLVWLAGAAADVRAAASAGEAAQRRASGADEPVADPAAQGR